MPLSSSFITSNVLKSNSETGKIEIYSSSSSDSKELSAGFTMNGSTNVNFMDAD